MPCAPCASSITSRAFGAASCYSSDVNASIPAHIAAVDDQVALNALEETRKALSDQARFMIDMSRQGVCGNPADFRQRFARAAQSLADRFEFDRAVAEPLADLAHILRTATDDEDSRELCVRGLGAAWRAEYPFRRVRSDNSYNVLGYSERDDTRLYELRALFPDFYPEESV